MTLECKICFESFNLDDRKPMTLSCGHSYCMQCIKQLLSKSPICSSCRKPIPYKDIDEVPVSFLLMEMCENSEYANIFDSGKIAYQNLKFDPKYSAGPCEEHGGFPRHIWCCRCRFWVCITCALINHEKPPIGVCTLKTGQDALEDMKFGQKLEFEKDINDLSKFKRELQGIREFLVTPLSELELLVAKMKTNIEYIDRTRESVISIEQKMRQNVDSFKELDSLELVNEYYENVLKNDKDTIFKNLNEKPIIYHEVVSRHIF